VARLVLTFLLSSVDFWEKLVKEGLGQALSCSFFWHSVKTEILLLQDVIDSRLYRMMKQKVFFEPIII